jgi:hypothetical protein
MTSISMKTSQTVISQAGIRKISGRNEGSRSPGSDLNLCPFEQNYGGNYTTETLLSSACNSTLRMVAANSPKCETAGCPNPEDCDPDFRHRENFKPQ